jgi:acyl-CoA thioesterase YciA
MPGSKELIQNEIPQIRVVMLPKDTNAMGTIFGGVILSYIDLAASQHAVSLKPHLYVTKIMREVDFIAPVNVGDTVSFYTETIRKGTSSVTVKVLVTAERGVTQRKAIKVTEAEVVMVAVDKDGNTVKVFNSK